MTAFSRRIANACVTHPDCPKVEHGRVTWLARQLKLSPQAVQKWFDGNSMPSEANSARVANFLNVDPSWLRGAGDSDAVMRAFSPDDDLLKIMRAWPEASPDLKKFLANAVDSTFPLPNK